MRSPTLNNNHPSPHDINTNKQPQQQTNGNGVKDFQLKTLFLSKRIF